MNNAHLWILNGECYLNDDGNLVQIEQDWDCDSPREWDNLGTFYTWCRDYYSPDRDAPDFDELVESFGFDPDRVTNPQQLANNLNAHGYIALPVSKYEHSGVVYRAGSTDQFYDRWDSCYCGIIFVSRRDVMYPRFPSPQTPILPRLSCAIEQKREIA